MEDLREAKVKALKVSVIMSEEGQYKLNFVKLNVLAKTPNSKYKKNNA